MDERLISELFGWDEDSSADEAPAQQQALEDETPAAVKQEPKVKPEQKEDDEEDLDLDDDVEGGGYAQDLIRLSSPPPSRCVVPPL